MKNIQNKIVVITGAGSGIGRALALECGRRGAKLALNDWSADGLTETVGLLQAQGISTVYQRPFDVSDEEAMFMFAAEVQQHFGNAHVIINNAGIAGSSKPVYSTPISTYRQVMEVNFIGVVCGTKAFLPQLVANNEGAVVNISSVMGFFGAPSASDYSASKFAVRGFTEALSVEFHKSPIHILCVHPGGINTNIATSAMTDGEEPFGSFDETILTTPPEQLARRIVQGIIRKKARVVYGNQSLKAWLGSTFLPKWLQDKIIWNKLRKTLKLGQYRPFIKTL